jgi:hypothetical protein
MIVDRISWLDFYLLCTLLAVPGMLLQRPRPGTIRPIPPMIDPQS